MRVRLTLTASKWPFLAAAIKGVYSCSRRESTSTSPARSPCEIHGNYSSKITNNSPLNTPNCDENLFQAEVMVQGTHYFTSTSLDRPVIAESNKSCNVNSNPTARSAIRNIGKYLSCQHYYQITNLVSLGPLR